MHMDTRSIVYMHVCVCVRARARVHACICKCVSSVSVREGCTVYRLVVYLILSKLYNLQQLKACLQVQSSMLQINIVLHNCCAVC